MLEDILGRSGTDIERLSEAVRKDCNWDTEAGKTYQEGKITAWELQRIIDKSRRN